MILDGWEEIGPPLVEEPLAADDLERFLHGAQPWWRHALAPASQVPRRAVVAEAVAALDTGAGLVLLVGPAADGKSTAVRQLAVDVARRGGERVLFRCPGGPCAVDAVARLPAGERWVLVSDDADEIAAEVARVAGSDDVRWVLAAREADWNRVFGRREPAWDQLGEVVRIAAAGNFFDGWTDDGQLERVLVGLADDRLRDAFLYAAAADAVGIDGVDRRVVAALVGRDGCREALGSAGLATGSGDTLRTRHPALARAAVGLMNANLASVFSGLVRGTGEATRVMPAVVSDGPIMTCGPVLAERLRAAGVPAERAGAVARAAADEAARVLDSLLVMVVYRARTYGGEAGAAILTEALDGAPAKEDWGQAGRGYLSELGASAKAQGRLMEAAVLAGLAVADVDGLGPVALVDARAPLAALGAIAMELQGDGAFRPLLRSVAHLGRRVTPNWDTRAKDEFRRYGSVADELDVPESTTAQACQWLAEAVGAAYGRSDDAQVQDLPGRILPGGALGFSQLQRTAGR